MMLLKIPQRDCPVKTKRGPKWYHSKGLALNMWCGAFISIFFSLHPLISIKQLSATTAERIGVVY